MKIDVLEISIFIFFFVLITVIGFVAARWRRGDLRQLNEWGLAGRRFGTVVTWFLLGGDLYTAYTFIAVPGAVFTSGAIGFFAVPYTVLVYPFIFILMPKFWTVCKQRGYITASDFVKDRFGSSSLALAVAFTGILATLPYIALQMFGIQVSIQALIPPQYLTGIFADVPLFIAFVILAAYTYTSGLRAPALIALVKDVMVLTLVLVAVIYVPIRLGGFAHIFAVATAHQPVVASKIVAAKASGVYPPSAFTIFLKTPGAMVAYTTLALGSALALFLYPHSQLGVLSSNSRNVVKRNTALLPIYSLMLGLLALLGFMALALPKLPATGNGAVVAVITQIFPDWFAGFAFAAISIGALVPAAVMSIAAANLFTRNVYKEYFRPNCTEREESEVAKIASFLLKFGALLFIIFVPTTNIISFQLLGGVWIIQTLPPVFLGLYTHWFNRWALLVGWAAGMISGTLMAFSAIIQGIPKAPLLQTYPIFGIPVYAAFAALIVNLVLAVVLTPIFGAIGLRSGKDVTTPADYEYAPVEPKEPIREALG
jgi:solute:Na+ symporter, SSS family